MARVSVITPTHNSAAHLRQAVGSVLEQSFSDWEMVVVDDASDDDTAAVAAEFTDPRVRLVSSPVNLGPAGARNLALSMTTAPLVAFLDADDYWHRDFLKHHIAAYDAAREMKRIGIVSGDALVVDTTGHVTGLYRQQHKIGREVNLRRILKRNPIFVSSLVPRNVLDEVGGEDAEIWGAEDFDLWVRILESGYHALLLEPPLAIYRRHDAALTAGAQGALRAAKAERLVYEKALARGRLTRRDALVAKRMLRYNRALEAVMAAVEGGLSGQGLRRLTPSLPLVVGAALTTYEMWPTWTRGLLRRVLSGKSTGGL